MCYCVDELKVTEMQNNKFNPNKIFLHHEDLIVQIIDLEALGFC